MFMSKFEKHCAAQAKQVSGLLVCTSENGEGCSSKSEEAICLLPVPKALLECPQAS